MVEIYLMRAVMATSSSSLVSRPGNTAARSGFSSNRTEESHADAASRLEAACQYKRLQHLFLEEQLSQQSVPAPVAEHSCD
jgi:hypothetical protein